MKKQFIPMILFICGALLGVAGMLMVCVSGLAIKIAGGVLIFIGVCLIAVGYFLTYKIRPARDPRKKKRPIEYTG
ncbi:MAG: hypothetical protein K2N22_00990, partial [Clostridia bacterium]|nr:hypothetical protein [Clostridia bacterium]